MFHRGIKHEKEMNVEAKATSHTQGQTTRGQLFCLRLLDSLFKLSFSYFSQQN